VSEIQILKIVIDIQFVKGIGRNSQMFHIERKILMFVIEEILMFVPESKILHLVKGIQSELQILTFVIQIHKIQIQMLVVVQMFEVEIEMKIRTQNQQ
jgi:hypothetical protein